MFVVARDEVTSAIKYYFCVTHLDAAAQLERVEHGRHEARLTRARADVIKLATREALARVHVAIYVLDPLEEFGELIGLDLAVEELGSVQ